LLKEKKQEEDKNEKLHDEVHNQKEKMMDIRNKTGKEENRKKDLERKERGRKRKRVDR